MVRRFRSSWSIPLYSTTSHSKLKRTNGLAAKRNFFILCSMECHQYFVPRIPKGLFTSVCNRIREQERTEWGKWECFETRVCERAYYYYGATLILTHVSKLGLISRDSYEIDQLWNKNQQMFYRTFVRNHITKIIDTTLKIINNIKSNPINDCFSGWNMKEKIQFNIFWNICENEGKSSAFTLSLYAHTHIWKLSLNVKLIS